ncbi:BLUF domain-containing protein [Paracidovorax wautersii]|uniref:BLUF domain-containing protein n=1 Tax=Paracidovorax wautersii TaxID=1177982 RepID=UPI0031D3B945
MSHPSQPLYEILYTSLFSQDQPLSAIAGIAGHARRQNLRRGITGLLVFDGQRFGQQLEGPEDEVRALLQRIRDDPRHLYVEVLHHGPIPLRRFRNFSLAFSTLEDAAALERLQSLRGLAALRAFADLPVELE